MPGAMPVIRRLVPSLGAPPVFDGLNPDVVVEIDMTAATGTLYATLYPAEGEDPVLVDGEPVRETFTVRDFSLSD